MSDGNQIVPLAPANSYQRSEEEYATIQQKALRQKRSGKCFFYSLALIVILSAIILVFAIIVKPRTPRVKLSSVAVEHLSYGNNPIPSFNMTLAAEVSVKNSNFVRFKFENTSSSALYKGMVVGEAKLRSGRVGARKTRMNIVVKIGSPGSLSEAKNLSSDINSGMLKMNSYATLKGDVRLFGIVKNRTAVMSCGMNLNLSSRSIQDLECS
jgi:hypothetical protein